MNTRPVTLSPSQIMRIYESKEPLPSTFCNLVADLTFKLVTQLAYLANGLNRKQSGLGQSLVNSLLNFTSQLNQAYNQAPYIQNILL